MFWYIYNKSPKEKRKAIGKIMVQVNVCSKKQGYREYQAALNFTSNLCSPKKKSSSHMVSLLDIEHHHDWLTYSTGTRPAVFPSLPGRFFFTYNKHNIRTDQHIIRKQDFTNSCNILFMGKIIKQHSVLQNYRCNRMDTTPSSAQTQPKSLANRIHIASKSNDRTGIR